MSGHSKWSSIKHKKSRMDDKRGKVFTKLIKEISTAARTGGSDENANPRLRQAIISAKSLNMPVTNIDRAIKKGTGKLPGVTYDEGSYEGYGPGGVAIFIDVLTDNKNRCVSEIRHALSKYSGSLAESGAVAYMFEKKGQIIIEEYSGDEDNLMEIVLEAGADDIVENEGTFEVLTTQASFESVHESLESANVPIANAEVTMIPQNLVKVEGKSAETVLKLMEVLEDLEDVQNVYSNFDIDPSQAQLDTVRGAKKHAHPRN